MGYDLWVLLAWLIWLIWLRAWFVLHLIFMYGS